MMHTVVSMQQVSKRFRKTQALDQVSFEIPSGKVCTLLGANGSGKTTAIRTLLGLEKPDSGRCEVLGLNSARYGREVRARIGYVSEKPALYDQMTVAQTGWFTAGFYPPGFAQAFEQYCKRFQLDPTKRVSHLSKGMRSKLALSLALAHRPQLLILDEPTSGLDPLVRREFLESMAEAASQGQTVLLCSHQIREVERIADQVIILIGGRVICSELLEDLKQEIYQVVVKLETSVTTLPELPGEVLSHSQRGQQHHLLVRRLDESQLACSQFPEASIQVHRPGLEEILIELLRAEPGLDALENAQTA